MKLAWLPLALLAACQAVVPGPLPRSTPEAEGFSPARLERVHELVERSIEAGEHAGALVLIARHGKIVDARSFGVRDVATGEPMEHDTIVRLYSMTKVVTAVAVLQLVEQGVVAFDDPLSRWVPEAANVQVFAGGTADAPVLAPPARPITIRMLLNHTAGFAYDFGAESPTKELYTRADLWNATSLDDFAARVGTLSLVAQPGTAFHYGINDDVLGVVVQRASGIPFEDFVARHITQPLAMHDTSFDVPPAKMHRLSKLHSRVDGTLKAVPAILGVHAEAGRGIPCGGAGLFSTIGDYARFAQCLLDGGELDGVRILSRKMVELALRNSLPAGVDAFRAGEGWGLVSGVRVDPSANAELASAGTFHWSGAATTTFFADPSEELLALVFFQHLPFDEHKIFKRFRTAVYQALE